MITIKLIGMQRVQRNLKTYATSIPAAGRAGLWNFTQHLAKQLRNAAPMGASGNMKSPKHTRAEKVSKDNYVIKMPFYTKYVEKGTGPAVGRPSYFIPKRKKILKYVGSGNFYAFKNYIYKHGTKPHPFTERIIQANIKHKLRRDVEKKIFLTIRTGKK